jgi:hypothetical protein
VTDKQTIAIIEKLSDKVGELQVSFAQLRTQMNMVLWIMGAILMAILPAMGFLIAFWINNG